MELTYNGLTYTKDIICLTDVPNLITYSSSSTVNVKAKYNIMINQLSNVDPDETYFIYFGDYKIKSVPELSMAGGTNFWLPPVDSYDNQLACCNSIVKALRNVPYIAANFNVWLSDNHDGTMANDVYIEAKKPGSQFNVDISSELSDIGDNTFRRIVNGSSNDEMTGKDNRITVDVYKFNERTRIGGIPDPLNREFITSLEKSYSGKPVTFNVSPVLSTIVDAGEIEQYCFSIYAFSDGQLKFSHMTEPCFISNGYQVNKSEPFIGTFTNRFFAQSVNRGDESDLYNKGTLYTYYPTIQFSLYTTVTVDVNSTQVTVNYMSSSLTVAHTDTVTLPVTDITNSLNHYKIQLNDNWFKEATYIDIVIPDVGTIRYNVIKPINGTDARDAERICWFNEYGGISFMDFTGERTEQRKEDIEYYSKQIHGFYIDDGVESEAVYDKNIDITVKHMTHKLGRDAKWLLFSLQKSSVAWIEKNSIKYYITIEDLEIKEANVSHIFTAEVSYKYSYPDFI